MGGAVTVNRLRLDVQDLLGMDERSYVDQLNELIRRQWSMLEDVAAYLCRYQGCDWARFGQDFTSIAAAELARMIASWRQEPAQLEAVGKIEHVLIGRCRNATRQALRECRSPASGMSTRLLVHSMLASLEAQMEREAGRPCSPQEVVQEHNRRMLRTRKDPVRSGVIATLEDYHLHSYAESLHWTQEDSEEPSLSAALVRASSVEPEHAGVLEAEQMSRQIIAACYETAESLGRAAEAGLSVLVEDGPAEAAEAICQATGCSSAQAKASLKLVIDLAREVAVGAWGAEER